VEPAKNTSRVFARDEKARSTVVSKTIEDNLRPYHIGPKLRALRLKKSMGLVELGKHTGLSPALLSKLERDKLYPTLPTLLRISMVFSVGLDYFFTDERKRHIVSVVRKEERIKLPERPGTTDVAYYFESLDFKANERHTSSYLADFELVEPEKLRPHQHPGFEFLHVMKGKLGLKIGLDDFELDAGDSVYFDASVPHTYRRIGKPASQAMIVTAA
jgi:transcriptional regulator with XRE-family HTH domain